MAHSRARGPACRTLPVSDVAPTRSSNYKKKKSNNNHEKKTREKRCSRVWLHLLPPSELGLRNITRDHRPGDYLACALSSGWPSAATTTAGPGRCNSRSFGSLVNGRCVAVRWCASTVGLVMIHSSNTSWHRCERSEDGLTEAGRREGMRERDAIMPRKKTTTKKEKTKMRMKMKKK